MQNQSYRHALDYLKELFEDDKTPAWLTALISGAIVSNFNISDESFDKLVNNFVWGKFSTREQVPTFPPIAPSNNAKQAIMLTKLVHKSGVNALKANAELKFGKDMTVVFGRNGSGKSGYFRILNGGRPGGVPKPILSNVYSNGEETTPIQVVIEYQQGAQPVTVTWDGNAPVQAFSGMLVFNQEYARQLIQKRGVSSAVIAPFGLHMFADLTKTVDSFKEKLGTRLEKMIQKYPAVPDQILANNYLAKIQNDNMLLEQLQEDLQKTSFTQDEAVQLESKRKELAEYAKTDLVDTLRLKRNIHADIDTLLMYIHDTIADLKARQAKWNKSLEEYQKAFQNAEQARAQYGILASIPGSDTQAWKTFIQSAATYRQEQKEEKSNVCPYCRQEIRDESAIELLKCYGVFLKDASQTAFETERQRLQLIQNQIKRPRSNYKFGEALKEDLEHRACGGKTCFGEYEDWLQQVISFEGNLSSLVAERQRVECIVPTCPQLVDSLQNGRHELSQGMEHLQAGEETRKKRMAVLEGEIKELEHRQRLVQYRRKIRKWIRYHRFVLRTKSEIDRVSSARVSSMARRAHNELLTENLKNQFAARYAQFSLAGAKVVLKVAEVRKGDTKTELVLETSRDCAIDDVLSEGEQKAVELAMFLTEADMNPSLGPLVFDDPVTSLDNGVIEIFVRMLLAMDRQIIVFTHNQYFLDCIQKEPSGHLCKNYQNGCTTVGKHVLLWEIRRFKGVTGIASRRTGEKAKDLIEAVHKKLFVEPDTASCDALALQLRSAVEKFIDETLLLDITPCRYNCGTGHINWKQLTQLNVDASFQQTVEQLRRVYSRLSNGSIHESATHRENPLSLDELERICRELALLAGITLTRQPIGQGAESRDWESE